MTLYMYALRIVQGCSHDEEQCIELFVVSQRFSKPTVLDALSLDVELSAFFFSILIQALLRGSWRFLAHP